jgi:hypothetical protein
MHGVSSREKSNIKPLWINTSAGLDRLIEELFKEPLVAVDTESDSL